MAPNRKQIALALDPFVDNTQLVQAKYLPLTTEVSTSQAAPSEPTIIRSNNVDEDYWAWEAPAAEEKKVNLFSTDRMIQLEAARPKETTTSVASHDDYWAERIEARYSEENKAVSESTGYWEWPEEATAVQIALILKEEFARQQVSAERMEERLRADAAATQHRVVSQGKAENDDYWSWESPTIVHAKPSEVSESYWEWDGAVQTEQSQHNEQIAAIVAYEKARLLLAADHIEKQLVQSSLSTTESSSAIKDSNDSYWNWPAEEDDYWNMRPLPAATVAAAPSQGYWDW